MASAINTSQTNTAQTNTAQTSTENTYSEERARAELVRYSQLLYARGWVANHDGNLSIRVGPDRIVTTPTAVSKGDLRPEWLIVVNLEGKKLEGTRSPFSELALHLKVYRERADVLAVVHAHPPTACGFAVAGMEIDPCILPEAVVSMGDRIPLAPLALPFGEEGARALEGLTQAFDAALLEHHGVFTWGETLEQAFLRLELVEHLARIQLVAQQLGAVRRLPDARLAVLLERRTKAGLGPEARRLKASTRETGAHETGAHETGAPESGKGGLSTSGPAVSLPEGAAPSAWTGGEVARWRGGALVSPCSGEPRVTGEHAEGAGSPPPSGDALSAWLKQEVARVLAAR